MVALFGSKKSLLKRTKVAGGNRYFDRTYYLQTGNNPRWSNRDYETFAAEGYINNVVAHRAISLIARSVASIGLSYYELEGTKKKELDDKIWDNIPKVAPDTCIPVKEAKKKPINPEVPVINTFLFFKSIFCIVISPFY